ncbi:hypothetical protein IG631_22101 [Alternaria alternata]|nr:hypothetical protein IG631_22101 [Alternaria alternata]
MHEPIGWVTVHTSAPASPPEPYITVPDPPSCIRTGLDCVSRARSCRPSTKAWMLVSSPPNATPKFSTMSCSDASDFSFAASATSPETTLTPSVVKSCSCPGLRSKTVMEEAVYCFNRSVRTVPAKRSVVNEYISYQVNLYPPPIYPAAPRTMNFGGFICASDA